MEHVTGMPITDYCDRHTLSTGERLKLFLPVATASSTPTRKASSIAI